VKNGASVSLFLFCALALSFAISCGGGGKKNDGPPVPAVYLAGFTNSGSVPSATRKTATV